MLVDNLGILVRQLWQVGIQGIFIDGSFVENKDHPNDIDGYFECDLRYFVSRQLETDLNALDANRIWTWDFGRRRYDKDTHKRQLPMWHQYFVELYPITETYAEYSMNMGTIRNFPLRSAKHASD